MTVIIAAWVVFLLWIVPGLMRNWREATHQAEGPPEPEPSEPGVLCWAPLEQAAFERAVEEWGFAGVVRAFSDVYELDVYWAEDWESIA